MRKMKLLTLQQELEEYFAKNYTKKYVEFGGYFHIKPHKSLTKSPMEHYFASGKYKELNDSTLEFYWKEIKKRKFYWNMIGITVIVLFYVLNR